MRLLLKRNMPVLLDDSTPKHDGIDKDVYQYLTTHSMATNKKALEEIFGVTNKAHATSYMIIAEVLIQHSIDVRLHRQRALLHSSHRKVQG